MLGIYLLLFFQSRPNSRDFDEASTSSMNTNILQDKLNEVSSCLTTMLHSNTTNLSRSVSSVGEHHSNNFNKELVPKRAETFAGFDNNHEFKGNVFTFLHCLFSAVIS